MNATPSLSILRPRLQLPVISGNIERRMLLNFRCEPKTIARILPQPFRPKLVSGYAMAGICLIRLENIKPAFLPGGFGFKSENAAHRIAVEWDENGRRREGVFIPRRDTDSRLNTFAGGRLFPGIHHAAEFRVLETEDRFELEMNSDDGSAFVRVDGRVAENFSSQSVFRSLMEASEFFQGGALGWSARTQENEFDGLELNCREWKMEPLDIEYVESSFFRNERIFPAGSVEFDSAFLMRNIAHEWHACGRLVTSKGTIV